MIDTSRGSRWLRPPLPFPVPLHFTVEGGGRREGVKMLRNLLTLRRVAQKAIIGVPRRQITNRVKEKQKLFQEDNDVPVYLKGGRRDVLLYQFTTFLCLFGSSYAIYEISKM